jgi:hypothetical protein
MERLNSASLIDALLSAATTKETKSDNKDDDVLKNIELDNSNQLSNKLKSGIVGVTADGSKWVAQVKVDGKNNYLGRYDTIEEAASARDAFIRDVTDLPIQRRSKKNDLGVYKHGKGWAVNVSLNRAKHYLGTYSTKESAIAAKESFHRGEDVLKPERTRLSKSGVVGIHQANDKWKVQIRKNGIQHYLGAFPTFESAKDAREAFLRGEVVEKPQWQRESKSRSGIRGVYPNGDKWIVQVYLNGITYHVGSYNTIKAATAAKIKYLRDHTDPDAEEESNKNMIESQIDDNSGCKLKSTESFDSTVHSARSKQKSNQSSLLENDNSNGDESTTARESRSKKRILKAANIIEKSTDDPQGENKKRRKTRLSNK